MSISATVTPAGGGPISYAALSASATRALLHFDPGFAQYGLDAYHVPGQDGSYLVRRGFESRRLVLHVRYSGAAAAANYAADLAAMQNLSNTVVLPTGTYTRCQLIGAELLAPPSPGPGGAYELRARLILEKR